MVKALSSCRASTRARARFSNEARSIDLIDRSLNGYRGRQNGGGDASKASALVFRRDAISSSAVRMSRGNESFDHALAEGFLKPAHRELVLADTNPLSLIDRLSRTEVPLVEKWISPADT